jgi:hypothetical protein
LWRDPGCCDAFRISTQIISKPKRTPLAVGSGFAIDDWACAMLMGVNPAGASPGINSP